MTCSKDMDKYNTRDITDGLKRMLNWLPEGKKKRRRPEMKGEKGNEECVEAEDTQ
jgi:hypothetical protein